MLPDSIPQPDSPAQVVINLEYKLWRPRQQAGHFAIERLYFDAGEMSAAGTPVLSLLPAGALKVKFYLPEPARQGFALGDSVAVSCDGCPAGLTATLSYMASDPQFTPPVIYSRDERQRLSFLAEATLDPGTMLHPGQPVTLARPE